MIAEMLSVSNAHLLLSFPHSPSKLNVKKNRFPMVHETA